MIIKRFIVCLQLKMIKRFFKRLSTLKLLKKDNLYLFNLIAYLKRYLELVEILTNKMKKHKFKTFDDLANNYHQYKLILTYLINQLKKRRLLRKY